MLVFHSLAPNTIYCFENCYGDARKHTYLFLWIILNKIIFSSLYIPTYFVSLDNILLKAKTPYTYIMWNPISFSRYDKAGSSNHVLK